MSEQSPTLEKLKALCGEMLGEGAKLDAITMDTTLRGDLGFTSLYMIWMALAIENGFGIRLSDMDIGGMSTVGDIVRFIDAKKDTNS